MLTAEGAIMLWVYAQPPLLGWVLFVIGKRRLQSSSAFVALGLVRRRPVAVRAFECAVAGRLGSAGVGPQGGSEGACWAFVSLFLIYDLDLLFFLGEATFTPHWGVTQACLGFLYGALLVAGAWVDNNLYSPTWSYLP
jgi:hypothetical protein